jgi:hypothetical protein
MKRHAGLLMGLIVLGLGCGQGDGPQRFEVSGKVTYNGQPVPKGFITFEPDAEKGNGGPGGGADIVDGSFRTAAGKGVVGGPYLVKIVGYDGVAATVSGEELPEGSPLFVPYETRIEFPKQKTQQDFDVKGEAP